MNLVDISVLDTMIKTDVFNQTNMIFHMCLVIVLMIGGCWILYHYKPKEKRKVESLAIIDYSQIRRIEEEINQLGEYD